MPLRDTELDSSAVRPSSRWMKWLVLGPACMMCVSLLDLFLATRVFVTADPLTTTITFFIFGAVTGVPIQIALARSGLGARLDGESSQDKDLSYSRRTAAVAGSLSAISTVAWLYALSVADAALVIPLANLVPAFFGIIDSFQGNLRFRQVIVPLLVMMLGFWAVRFPSMEDLASLSPATLAALGLRNLATLGAEFAEKFAAKGDAAKFTAARFLWLAGTGIPIAMITAGLTDRGPACIQLLLAAGLIALPIHGVTMVFSFIGGYCRTRAKGYWPLTVCTAAYATPFVLAPIAAAAANFVAGNLFPTAVGSAYLVLGAVMVISGAAWLGRLALSTATVHGTPKSH